MHLCLCTNVSCVNVMYVQICTCVQNVCERVLCERVLCTCPTYKTCPVYKTCTFVYRYETFPCVPSYECYLCSNVCLRTKRVLYTCPTYKTCACVCKCILFTCPVQNVACIRHVPCVPNVYVRVCEEPRCPLRPTRRCRLRPGSLSRRPLERFRRP